MKVPVIASLIARLTCAALLTATAPLLAESLFRGASGELDIPCLKVGSPEPPTQYSARLRYQKGSLQLLSAQGTQGHQECTVLFIPASGE